MWQHVSTCALRDWPGRDLARIDATLTLVHDTITPVILDAECGVYRWRERADGHIHSSPHPTGGLEGTDRPPARSMNC